MDIQPIAEALGLKRAGSEFKGPCPLCGGHDRFHIKTGAQHDLILLCRQGCSYSDIMRELENRRLVPKGDYKPTLYRQADLNYADALIIVAEGNLKTDMSFQAADMLALSRMIGRVDQEREQHLQSLMDRLRGRLG